MLKTFVLGLDGVTFKLLNPWMESGHLPNFKKLKEQGACSVMQSCLPPVTCPNWKCYSTGKNPGRLGIFWWELVDVANRKIESVRYAEQVHAREIWDLMNDQGLKTAIINMPTTFPPKKVNGCMVAGGPDCQKENFTYPPELEAELKAKYGYRVFLDNINKLQDKDPLAVKEVMEQIERLFALGFDLIEQDRYDFIHLTVFCISVVEHFLWNDDLARDIMAAIDRQIGLLLSRLPEECGLVIMSDHGMKKVSWEFFINKWLEEQGYLKLSAEARQLPPPGNQSREMMVGLLEKLKLKKALKKMLPGTGKKMRPKRFGGGIKEEKAKLIDWAESKMVASGQGPLYLINKKDGDYESLRDEIIEKLGKLTDPKTGRRVIARVSRTEDIYPLITSDKAPDLMLEPEEGYRINGKVGRIPLFKDCSRWSGENDPPGIFFAYGRDIKPGIGLDGMTITDLAPTILHWMDFPVPDDMDGRVLAEIFAEDSPAAKREIKRCPGDELEKEAEISDYDQEEEELIRQRLADLGYLGE